MIFSTLSLPSNLLYKINGFYGLIGPEVNISKINSLYDLFMGNGVIQGVFFNDGNITFVKKFIKTEKFIHDEIFSSLNFNKFLKNIKNINILFPNILGLANTALFNVNKKVYALFERDQPYLLDIDFINKDIRTLSKINIRDVHHFSAHSKFNKKIIETIDYKILEKKVTYHQLDTNFKSIFNKDFNIVYIPIIHDFLSTEKSIIIFDFPLKIDIIKFLMHKITVLLDLEEIC
jgi:carotenoid cleavage dioxygenase-like enzyme